MAESFIVVNQESNTLVVSNANPQGEIVVAQNLTVSSDPLIQIITPNLNQLLSIINAGNPPSATNAPGSTGEIRFDNNFIYLCVTTNLWKKVSLQDL